MSGKWYKRSGKRIQSNLVFSFESTRKIHCPLMDIVGYHELSVESREFSSNEAELKKRIAQLESKNEELYKKLVNSHLN